MTLGCLAVGAQERWGSFHRGRPAQGALAKHPGGRGVVAGRHAANKKHYAVIAGAYWRLVIRGPITTSPESARVRLGCAALGSAARGLLAPVAAI